MVRKTRCFDSPIILPIHHCRMKNIHDMELPESKPFLEDGPDATPTGPAPSPPLFTCHTFVSACLGAFLAFTIIWASNHVMMPTPLPCPATVVAPCPACPGQIVVAPCPACATPTVVAPCPVCATPTVVALCPVCATPTVAP